MRTYDEKSPDTGALVVALLCFCEELKTTTTNIHTVNLPDGGREIRDQSKAPIFTFLRNERDLSKRLFSLTKKTLTLSRFEAAEFLLENTEVVFCMETEQTLLLKKLFKKIEEKYPRPWRLGSHHDRVIDSKDKVFSFLPSPEAGLSYKHLESFIYVGQENSVAVSTPATGLAY